MSLRSIIVIVLALVLGGTAAVGITLLPSAAGSRENRVPVVVAAQDMPRNTVLSAAALTTREFPKDVVPTGAIFKLEDALGRTTVTGLIKGEPAVEARLAPKGAGRGMAALVAPGLRAFTVQTTLASGVAGFILPGDRVDVLLTTTDGLPQTGGGATTTLLQNVEVLAVDQRLEAPAESKVDASTMRSVTLHVTPDQAAKAALGQNKGTLTLTLRTGVDDAVSAASVATLADLRFQQVPPLAVQLRGMVEAGLKVMAEARAREAAQQAALRAARQNAPPAAAAPKPPPLWVRTQRGTQEGVVEILQLGAAPAAPPPPPSEHPGDEGLRRQ